MKAITDLLGTFGFVSKALVFGSRAKGNHRKYSDVDICLFGEMGDLDAEKVRSGLNELNLIYDFDAVDYGRIKTPALREHIDRVGIVVYEREALDSATNPASPPLSP